MSAAREVGAPPLIGITASELRRREQVALRPQGEPGQTHLSLGLAYSHAIADAGGIPVILPPVPADEVRALLEHLDGLVLSGGPDLDPRSYGRDPHPQLGPIESEIDTFELALCAAGMVEGIPILGICRGMQLLNVAGGGTLHQHVPDLPNRGVLHRAGAGEMASHPVAVEPQSRFATLVGAAPLEVNSFHHQAVDRLAPGLRAVAWAPDGIIEAVEAEDGESVFGVQWHVESLTHDPRHFALLARFVDSARTTRLSLHPPTREVVRGPAA